MDIPTSLQTLSQDDQLMLADSLNQILVQSQTIDRALSDAEIGMFGALIDTFTADLLKYRIFFGFSHSNRLRIREVVSPASLVGIGAMSTDMVFLKPLFLQLSVDDQKKLLKKVYTKDKKRYQLLKQLVSSRVQYRQGVAVQSNPLGDIPVPKNESNRQLNQIVRASLSATAHLKDVESFVSHLSIDELDELVLEVIKLFNAQNVALDSPANCLSYIKFFNFVFASSTTIPDIQSYLKRVYDAVIIGLSRMPGPEWSLKVLMQFHPHAIFGVLSLLSKHATLSSLEKRTLYSKLFTSLRLASSHSEDTPVTSFFSQLNT